jgi:hypothetical protein
MLARCGGDFSSACCAPSIEWAYETFSPSAFHPRGTPEDSVEWNSCRLDAIRAACARAFASSSADRASGASPWLARTSLTIAKSVFAFCVSHPAATATAESEEHDEDGRATHATARRDAGVAGCDVTWTRGFGVGHEDLSGADV